MNKKLLNLCNFPRNDEEHWFDVFQNCMINDPDADTSILGYYLSEVTGIPSSIFCPLGNAYYHQLGVWMNRHDVILDAAIASGLMESAIPCYVEAALDVVENWNVHAYGVEHILNDRQLKVFVPQRLRSIAERVLDLFEGPVPDACLNEVWERCAGHLKHKRSRGYAY